MWIDAPNSVASRTPSRRRSTASFSAAAGTSISQRRVPIGLMCGSRFKSRGLPSTRIRER